MQSMMPDSSTSTSERVPLLIIRPVANGEMKTRFWNIGPRQKFITLLQRFRSEFLLARAQKIDGLDWNILRQSQKPEVYDFARRYGLKIDEEE